jgi:hypothetical protein
MSKVREKHHGAKKVKSKTSAPQTVVTKKDQKISTPEKNIKPERIRHLDSGDDDNEVHKNIGNRQILTQPDKKRLDHIDSEFSMLQKERQSRRKTPNGKH